VYFFNKAIQNYYRYC